MFSPGIAPDPFANTGRGLSLSAPLYLSYNVYIPYSTGPTGFKSESGHFGVDAVLNNTWNWPLTSLDSVTDNYQLPIFSSLDVSCNAAAMNLSRGQWIPVTCDLTELADYDIQQFLIVYEDPSSAGGGGEITAFFNNVTLEEPTYAKSFTNGGFELSGQPFGWVVAGMSNVAIVTASTGKVAQGNQALRIGITTLTGDSGSYGRVFQTVRLMNDLAGYALDLHLQYYSTIGSGGSVDAFIYDHQTGQSTYLVANGSGSTSNWVTVTQNVTTLEGHIITLYLETAAAPNTIAYSYFDNISLLTKSEAFFESGVTSTGYNGASLYMPQSVYDPACGLTYGIDLQNSFGTTNSHWQTYYQGNTPEPIEDNVSLSMDTWSFTHNCQGSNQDLLDLGITVGANATGVPRPPSGGGFVGVNSTCVTENFTYNSGDVFNMSTNLKGIASANLGGSAYPSLMVAAQQSEQDSGAGLAFHMSAELAVFLIVGDESEAIVFQIAVIIAAEILTWVKTLATATAPACVNPTGPLAKASESWDANGDPATQVAAIYELVVPVGCTIHNRCTGGIYDVSVNLTVVFCDLWVTGNPGQCYAAPFDVIHASLLLQIDTKN
jgi:hypothetical protein